MPNEPLLILNEEEADADAETSFRIDQALANDDGVGISQSLMDNVGWVCSTQASLEELDENPVTRSILEQKPNCFKAFLQMTDCDQWEFGPKKIRLGHVAASVGAFWALKMLRDEPKNYNWAARMSDGRDVLALACCCGTIEFLEETIELLKEENVLKNSGSRLDEYSPLAWAFFDYAEAQDSEDTVQAQMLEKKIRLGQSLGLQMDGRLGILGVLCRLDFKNKKISPGALKALQLAHALGASVSESNQLELSKVLPNRKPFNLLEIAAAELDPLLWRAGLILMQPPLTQVQKAQSLVLDCLIARAGSHGLRNDFEQNGWGWMEEIGNAVHPGTGKYWALMAHELKQFKKNPVQLLSKAIELWKLEYSGDELNKRTALSILYTRLFGTSPCYVDDAEAPCTGTEPSLLNLAAKNSASDIWSAALQIEQPSPRQLKAAAIVGLRSILEVSAEDGWSTQKERHTGPQWIESLAQLIFPGQGSSWKCLASWDTDEDLRAALKEQLDLAVLINEPQESDGIKGSGLRAI